jgi:type I restriction enzyme S subunit
MTTINHKRTLSEISVFGATPEGWAIDRIRDRLVSIVGGEWGDDPDAHDEGVLIPVIRVADIRGIDLTTNELTIRRIKESKLSGRLIGLRTVLLEKSGGGEQKPVGRAVRCRTITFDAICSNFMAKIECGTSLDPSFLVYLFNALYTCGVNGACIQQTTGIQNLRVFDYLNTKVGFPTLSEQISIAEFLDAKCSLLGDVVSTVAMPDNGVVRSGVLNRQIDILLAYQKSLIHECVTGQRRITKADLTQVKAHG